MRGTEGMYRVLVNRIPEIQDRYHREREQVSGAGRVALWFRLLGWNIQYRVSGRNRYGAEGQFERKVLPYSGSESDVLAPDSAEEFAKTLSAYDTISFDVFDTLVFRPFSSPADLFFPIGDRLEYPDFKRIRQEMEQKARGKKYKSEKHREICLEEIYDLLEQEAGIDPESGMQLEMDIEQEMCYANPYLKEVVEHLQRMGKRLIITSDMYLSEKFICQLLEHCGYDAFDAVYVSCEYGKSKSDGNMYDLVKEKESEAGYKTEKLAHVGDNRVADAENAKQHGFEPFLYPNINTTGAGYRAEEMSVITGSVYRGIVNAHLHNGSKQYSIEYEYGYVYGGLFVTGYCQWIHEYVHRNGIEKILFLARDGDVLSQAYHILFPDEDDSWEYVYWSRLAALKLTADHYKYDYYRRFLHHKINQDYTMKEIFTSMELDDMLEDFCKKTELKSESHLTNRNEDDVREYLNDNWDQILAHYQEQVEAGKHYYQKALEGCKNAVAVDIGWAGSGAITLRYMVRDVWNLDCEIKGLIAGSNTMHNAEPDMSETFLKNGTLTSFFYSQEHNRDLWKYHDAAKGHNLYWEMLLDAPEGSLIGFYLDKNNEVEIRQGKLPVDVKGVRKIQEGILDFVNQWDSLPGSLKRLIHISGRDAYAPMLIIFHPSNSDYRKQLEEMLDETNVD